MFISINSLFKSKLRKDVAGTFVTQMAIMLSAFVVNKILSNVLAIDDFGQYNVIRRSSSVLAFVMLGGVGIALPRYLSIYIQQRRYRQVRGFVCATFLYVFVNTLIVVLSCLVLGERCNDWLTGGGGKELLAVILAYSFFQSLCNGLYAYYRGIGNFKLFNITAILSSVLLILPLAAVQLISVCYVFATWGMLYAIVFIFYAWKDLHNDKDIFIKSCRWTNVKTEYKVLWKYSLPRLVGDLFLFTLSAFPVAYIGLRSMEQAAFYSVGISFAAMVTPLYSFLGVILLPYVSTAYAAGRGEAAGRFINKLLAIYMICGVCGGSILYFGMDFFIKLFFSETYCVATPISRLLIVSIPFQSLYYLYRNPIDARSSRPYNTVNLGICLAVLIVLFSFAETLEQFAYAFLAVSVIKGALSVITWHLIK